MTYSHKIKYHTKFSEYGKETKCETIDPQNIPTVQYTVRTSSCKMLFKELLNFYLQTFPLILYSAKFLIAVNFLNFVN